MLATGDELYTVNELFICRATTIPIGYVQKHEVRSTKARKLTIPLGIPDSYLSLILFDYPFSMRRGSRLGSELLTDIEGACLKEVLLDKLIDNDKVWSVR
jgi:hypothetical protein